MSHDAAVLLLLLPTLIGLVGSTLVLQAMLLISYEWIVYDLWPVARRAIGRTRR